MREGEIKLLQHNAGVCCTSAILAPLRNGQVLYKEDRWICVDRKLDCWRIRQKNKYVTRQISTD